MPRDGSNIYSAPSGTTAVSGTAVASAPYNALVSDLTTDLNAARPISAGGTGATSASGARTNLGVSATDATITAIAALDFSAAGSMLYSTAADTFSLLTSTVAGRALLTAADASAQRTALGLGTAALKATGTSGNNVPLLDGANTWSGDQTISSTGPNFYLQETDASTNNKLWRMLAQGEDLYFGAVNDALSSAGYWAVISRTGVTIDSIALSATALSLSGVTSVTGATLSSPTLSGTVAGSVTLNGVITLARAGTPLLINSTDSTAYKQQFLDNGSSRGYVGADSTYSLIIGTSAGTALTNWTNSSGLLTHNFDMAVAGALTARVAISSETSGTLTSASANKHLALTGNITLNNSVFSANDKMTLDPGTSARTITRGSGCTMYVNGTDSATATLAANQMGGVHVRSASVFVLTGAVS